MTTSTAFSNWMRVASKAEQEQLAQAVGTTRAYLYALSAADGADYRREPKPALARNIEHATAAMHKSTKGRLPLVYRTDLVTACRECEFAQRCLAATSAEFPAIPLKEIK